MNQENQRELEWMYSKQNVKAKILKELADTPELAGKISECAQLIRDWAAQEWYSPKRERIDEFMQANQDLEDTVLNILATVLPKKVPELFTSVVGEISAALHMGDKGTGAKTAAELLVIMCEADVYDIYKDEKYASLKLVSNYELSEELQRFMMQVRYLPPMICPPRILRSNKDSGYLTERKSVILGKGNHHSDDVCLDSINKFNQVPLTLNKKLLTTLSERPKNKFKDMEQREQWLRFVRDSYDTYKMLIQYGNEFYLTHRVDKRGRTYAQGYHVSTQGNSFRKAMIQFAEPELVEGI